MGSSFTLTILNHHVILRLKLRNAPNVIAATLQMELTGTAQVLIRKINYYLIHLVVVRTTFNMFWSFSASVARQCGRLTELEQWKKICLTFHELKFKQRGLTIYRLGGKKGGFLALHLSSAANNCCSKAKNPKHKLYSSCQAQCVRYTQVPGPSGLRKTELLVCKVEMCFVMWKPWDTGAVFALEGIAEGVTRRVCTQVGGSKSLAVTWVAYGSKRFSNRLSWSHNRQSPLTDSPSVMSSGQRCSLPPQ